MLNVAMAIKRFAYNVLVFFDRVGDGLNRIGKFISEGIAFLIFAAFLIVPPVLFYGAGIYGAIKNPILGCLAIIGCLCVGIFLRLQKQNELLEALLKQQSAAKNTLDILELNNRLFRRN